MSKSDKEYVKIFFEIQVIDESVFDTSPPFLGQMFVFANMDSEC